MDSRPDLSIKNHIVMRAVASFFPRLQDGRRGCWGSCWTAVSVFKPIARITCADTQLNLKLSDADKKDLIEYLKGI